MERTNRIPTPRDPFARFRREHRNVLERLDTLETGLAGRRPSRAPEPMIRDTVEHLERQFATHMAAEDAVLFPAVAESFPEARETLAPLTDEHVTLRSMLVSLRGTLAGSRGSKRDEQIVIQTRDLIDLLRIHIDKEEAVVFALAERVLRPRGVRDLARRLHPFIHPVHHGLPAAPTRRSTRRLMKGTQS